MVLEDGLGRLGWGIDILATDLSTKVLGQASAGVWKADRGEPTGTCRQPDAVGATSPCTELAATERALHEPKPQIAARWCTDLGQTSWLEVSRFAHQLGGAASGR